MGKIAYYTREFENQLSGETLYCARLAKYSTLNAEQVVALAQQDANVNASDMAVAFSALGQAINDFVLNGHSVTLDGLGNFRLTAKTGVWDAKKKKWKSAGRTSMDDVSASDIKGIYVRFRPCTELRRELENVELFDMTKTLFGGTVGGYDYSKVGKPVVTP